MSESDIIVKQIGDKKCVKLVEHNDHLLVRKEIKMKDNGLEKCEREVKMLDKVLNDDMMIYKDSYFSKEEEIYYLYSEYYKNGSLHDKLEKQNHRDIELFVVLKCMKELINGLKYIHSKNIIHRDLKPGNILVGDYGNLIISDFGLSIEQGSIDNLLRGTYNYIAPELWDVQPPPYSTASDIFALGCIFYEIYTLKQLYAGKDKEKIKAKIINKNDTTFGRNNLERNLSMESLIEKMIRKDPRYRIDLSSIERRVEIIDEDLKNSSLPKKSLCFCWSDYSSLDYNITVGFYLHNEHIARKSLEDICKMNQKEFNQYWKYDYLNMIFPVVDQDIPPFTVDDLSKLKEGENKYLDNLKKLLDEISHLDEVKIYNISKRMKSFLFSVGLEYLFDEIFSPSQPRRIPVYYYGDVHPSRWIHVTDVEIEICPFQVIRLYYETPNNRNRLLSVNVEPTFTTLKGTIIGSEGLDVFFLNKIRFGDWWWKNKEEGYIYVPVYQRDGYNISIWAFRTCVAIDSKYKDQIHCFYFGRRREGNELLSVIGKPDFYHLKEKKFEGSSGIDEEYLNKISQYGWWINEKMLIKKRQ